MAMSSTAYQQTEDLHETGAPDEEAIRQKLEVVVSRLQVLADEQVGKKTQIEERWYDDLRAYHGRYDPTTEANLKAEGKSRVYANLTRQKTNAWEARLSDMLFPTDDKNWGIKPTPVPSLIDEAQQAADAAKQAAQQANEAMAAGGQEAAEPIVAQGNQFAEMAGQLSREADEARRRCELMEQEIEDQLRECGYNIRARDSIHDSCKLGTGIMKGPLVSNRTRRKWTKVQEGQRTLYVMEEVADPRPEFLRVDPWNFFPDMSAATIAEAEFTFERHLKNKKELRKLAKQPGFDRDAIRRLLEQGPQSSLPPYIAHLREIAGLTESMEARYQVWEYHGPLEKEDVECLMSALGDTEGLEAIEADPLDEINVIVWFCQGTLLKFGIHPMDSGETLYSVFNFERDDTSIFGYGVPYLMRDSQNALNGAWRMSMDNAALSVGPQVVVDQSQVEPENGSWTMEPRKVWVRKKAGVVGGPAVFEVFNIPNNQAELANIISMARQFADDETNMPLIAQGESAGHVTTTANGMAMLMNSANVVFRRVVKCYDDDMTTPSIRRLYDWNMQFSQRDEIKGDMQVDARGSSVLLVREMQAANLMNLVTMWTGHPVLGGLLKVANAARKTVQALMIPSDEVIKSDEELRQDAERAAQEEPQPSPEEIRAQVQLQIAREEGQVRLQVAQLDRDTAMMKLAHQHNMKLTDLQAMLEAKRIEQDGKERILATEVAVEERQHQRAAVTGVPAKGSGGYI